MTVYKIFNENLARIPSLAMDAQKVISVYGWPEMRKKHAEHILSQLYGGCPLIRERCDSVVISLRELNLTLSPAECGIEDSDVFDEQNIKKADCYVKELIADMNNILKDVMLRYGGHYPKKNNSICVYSIEWEF